MWTRIIDWILFLLVAVVIVFVLIGRSLMGADIPVTYHDAVSSGSVTYHDTAPVLAVRRPIVKRLSASWCAPCRALGSRLTTAVKADLPFEIQDSNVDVDGFQGLSSIPAAIWFVDGKRYTYQGSNTDELVRLWKQSQRPATSAPVTRYRTVEELRAFARTYRGPLTGIRGKRDDYRSHLLERPNHDFEWWQVKDLQQWECQRLHGAQHAGFISARVTQ